MKKMISFFKVILPIPVILLLARVSVINLMPQYNEVITIHTIVMKTGLLSVC